LSLEPGWVAFSWQLKGCCQGCAPKCTFFPRVIFLVWAPPRVVISGCFPSSGQGIGALLTPLRFGTNFISWRQRLTPPSARSDFPSLEDFLSLLEQHCMTFRNLVLFLSFVPRKFRHFFLKLRVRRRSDFCYFNLFPFCPSTNFSQIFRGEPHPPRSGFDSKVMILFLAQCRSGPFPSSRAHRHYPRHAVQPLAIARLQDFGSPTPPISVGCLFPPMQAFPLAGIVYFFSPFRFDD